MNDVALALIEHVSWPFVMFLGFLLLRKEFAALLSRLRSFKSGSIELQLSEQIHNQGFSREQLASIGTLSADEIDIFLLVSFTDIPEFKYSTGIASDVFKQRMLRLQEAGLLRVTNPDDTGTNLHHNLTPLGRRLRALLINSTTQLLRESA